MTVEGTVESANPKGIKLGGEWRNVSKFRPVDLPPVGSTVRADIDAKGFLTSIELLDEHTSVTASVSQRDRQIARLAVLKAAAAFCAGKAMSTEVSSRDVLAIADSWLAWVTAE
jgi:hypothetical protein